MISSIPTLPRHGVHEPSSKKLPALVNLKQKTPLPSKSPGSFLRVTQDTRYTNNGSPSSHPQASALQHVNIHPISSCPKTAHRVHAHTQRNSHRRTLDSIPFSLSHTRQLSLSTPNIHPTPTHSPFPACVGLRQLLRLLGIGIGIRGWK